VRLRAAVGALAERNFRLLFASSTISGLGDGISVVALVFAVLQVSDSAIALGLVLAARQVTDAAIVLAAGVWADRLPRHLVLIAVAIVQGAAQATTGALVITGSATIAMIVGLQAGSNRRTRCSGSRATRRGSSVLPSAARSSRPAAPGLRCSSTPRPLRSARCSSCR